MPANEISASPPADVLAHTATDLETLIRTRRTHKAYGPEPVDRETLLELFELARWAPNHHLTNPWRFHVLGPQARAILAREAELEQPGSARKLERAPTLIVVGVEPQGDPSQRREDLLAGAVAAYIVLLAAHARGLAGYWRTLPLLEQDAVRAGLKISATQEPIGLLHLGRPVQAQRAPERAPVRDIATFLD
ncbi:MAG TPA: nitroreductase family protein [Solirubrobacteraceae bacterium]|jgi:nitroreductase